MFISTVIRSLSSKSLSIRIFFCIALLLAISTFSPPNISALIGTLTNYLLGLLALMIGVCTCQKWKNVSTSTIVIHSGFILCLAGGLVSSTGYIATINVYQGDSTASAFRWDTQQDILFPFELAVNKIHQEYYPTPVKIGVLKNGTRHKLIETKTGSSFNVDESIIYVKSLDITKRTLTVTVESPGVPTFTYTTSPETSAAPPPSPLAFQLVAFQTPYLKKTWADLSLLQNKQPVFSGQTSVNSPLKWEGFKFFLTAVNRDSGGVPFAGIQIVRDPGTLVTFLGFAILCLGLIQILIKKT